MLSYAQAFREHGVRLDLCYLHASEVISYPRKVELEPFERVFVPPRRIMGDRKVYEFLDQHFDDPFLAEMGVTGSKLFAGAQIVAAGQYDFALVHYSPCHQLVDMLQGGIPMVLHSHDLDSVVRNQKGNIIPGVDDYSLVDEVRRFEKFDLVTVVGPTDYGIVKQASSKVNLVEATYCPSMGEPKVIRGTMNRLLFMGLNIPFKRVSLQWFWIHCWPKLLTMGFRGTLDIVGGVSSFASELGMHKHPQCKIHGIVDSVEPYMEAADLLVAPYYYGAGIKTSILHAAAQGLPVITTTYGLINTHFKPNQDVFCADDAIEFAEKIWEARSQNIRSDLSHRAIETLRAKHDATSAYKEMVQRTLAIVSKRQNEIPNIQRSSHYHLEEELTEKLTRVIEKLKKNEVSRLALYGASTHTEILLDIWEKMDPGISIDCITVTETPTRNSMRGLEIVEIKCLKNRAIDAILASSRSFEVSMAIESEEHLPQVPFYSIWTPQLARDKDYLFLKSKKMLTPDKILERIPL